MKTINQFLTGATVGDAITGQAIIIRRWLHELGFQSDIFAQHIHPSMEDEVRPLSSVRVKEKEPFGIYHHSIGSDLPGFLIDHNFKILLIYHNVTPAKYFTRSDPQRAELANLGIRQLGDLRDRTVLALAVSPFNARDLQANAFDKVGVLPIALFPEEYDLPVKKSLVNEIQQTGPNLLFVGRLAPNKKQEELVNLLYFCCRLDPSAHLFLVGDRWEVGYDKWIESLAADLDISSNVTLTGKVSQEDIVTYYKSADVYVSMSDHEGFGIPLIESMYLELPVLAFGSSGVPSTMGQAGIVFYEKKYADLAELIHIVANDNCFRKRIVDRQKSHVQRFLEPQVRRQFIDYLQQVI